MGLLTRPEPADGRDVDLRPVFVALYRTWVRQGHGRNLGDLGRALEADGIPRYNRHTLGRFMVRPETASPHAMRQPPIWLLLNLCERTGSELILDPDAIHIRTRERVAT